MKVTSSIRISLFFILFHSQLIDSQSTPFRIRLITWNVGNTEPDCSTFQNLAWSSLIDDIKPDLLVFGFQEASEKRFSSTSFHSTFKDCLKNSNYQEIVSDYVGSDIIKPIWLYIFVSNEQSQRVELLKYDTELTLKVLPETWLSTAFVKVIGYKGLIAARLQIDQSMRLVFVNMHLPAGEGKTDERCKLWLKFIEKYEKYNYFDDYMFAFGDQNWRTLPSLALTHILKAIQDKNYETIINNEELTKIRRDKTKKCFSTFFEAPIQFPPSYKYVPKTNGYQIRKNNEDRRPSYTDRILVSPNTKNLKFLQYSSMNEIKLSDHRPVFADVIFNEQPKQEKTTSMKSSKSSHRTTSTVQPETDQPPTNNSFLLPIIIVISTLICVFVVFILYYFLIKPRLQRTDIRSH